MGQIRSIGSARIEVPPELEALTKEEVVRLRRSGLRDALQFMGGGMSEARPLLEKAWLALHTTRRWNPSKAPLPIWFRRIIKSYAYHAFRDTTRLAELEQEAMEGAASAGLTHTSSPSAEAEMVARETAAERTAATKQRLEMLMPRIKMYPVVVGVLKGKLANKTNAQIAQELGVTTKVVSRAEETINYHLENIREELEGKANVRT